MKTQEFKIVAPEGYELDKENSTFERIVFKKKSDNKPKSWEEFCKRGFTGKEAYVSVLGVSRSKYMERDRRSTFEVGYVDNLEEARAFQALMQLRQLRKAWVGDWEPDWKLPVYKHLIERFKDDVQVSSYMYINRSLSFPTEEMAKDFLNCFKNLIEQAKILL